jgi:potassium channel subfamily K
MPTEQLSNNTHDKNLLLAQAIKAVAIDHIKNQQTNSRQDYSFEDWEYIFYLMGVLEPSNDEQTAPAGEENPGNPVLKPACSNLEEWTDGGQILDWLHGKNPLNGSDTVTEWVLLSLVDKLEMELLELRKQLGSTSVQ